MLETVAPRKRKPRRKDITVWKEHVTVSGSSGETLEVLARLYPDSEPSVVVLEEISSNGSLSIFAQVQEILLELAKLYPETMQDARVTAYQPRNLWTTRARYMEWRRSASVMDGWRPVWRQELVKITEDTQLPPRRRDLSGVHAAHEGASIRRAAQRARRGQRSPTKGL